MNCRWWIQGISQEHVVHLQFLTFDVPATELDTLSGDNGYCLHGHVSVFNIAKYPNGNITTVTHKVIGRFCNSFKPPAIIISTGPILELEYGSNSTEVANSKGFLAKYHTIYNETNNNATYVEKQGKSLFLYCFLRVLYWGYCWMCTSCKLSRYTNVTEPV